MRFLTGLLVFLIFFPIFSVNAKREDRPGKKVLLLVSYHMTHPWTQQLVRSIMDGTRGLPNRLVFNVVEFDALRSRDQEAWNRKIQGVLSDIKENKYSMVITLDDTALDLLLSHYAELPKNLPIIFSGYENFTSEQKTLYPNMTGVVQNFDMEATIRAGLALYPHTKEIVILTDHSLNSRKFVENLKRTLPSFGSVKLFFLTDDGRNIHSLFEKIYSLPENSLLMLGPWRGLYDNDYQSVVSFGMDLSEFVHHPYFISTDTLIGYGAIGGYMNVAKEHGRKTANVIRKVFLNGIENVPVVQDKAVPVFDYQLMAEHSLDVEKLPANTRFLNRPSSIWRNHRNEVLLASGSMFLLLFGFWGYMYLMRRNLKRNLEIFQMLPGRIGVLNRDEKILYMNVEDLDDECLARAKYLKDIPDIDYQKLSSAVKEVFQTGRKKTIDYEVSSTKRSITFARLKRHLFRQDTVIWFSHDNSEVQSLRRKYEENAEYQRLMLRSIGDAVLATDAEGNITMLNPIAERMMGYKQADVLGKPHTEVFRIFSYLNGDPIPSPLFQALCTGKTVELANHTDLLAADGKRYHIADSAAPIRDHEGQIIGAILVFRDVTEDYRKRDQLRDALTSLEYASELTRSASFRYHIGTHEISGSKLLPELYPIFDGRVLDSSEWVLSEDILRMAPDYEDLLKGRKEIVTFDYRTQYYGEMRYYRARTGVDRADPQNLYLVGVIQDVTEITRSAGELKMTQELWNLIIDSIPIMIFAKNVNDDFRYVLSNKYFEKFVGVPSSDIIGKTDYEIFHLPESAKHFREKDEAIIRNGVPEEFYENPIDGNGNQRHLRTTKMPFTGAEGESLLLGVVVDFTDLEKSRNDLERITKQSNYEKQMILNNINIPIWLYDEAGELVRVNTAVAEIAQAVGVPPEQLTAEKNREIFLEKKPSCGRPVENVIRTGKPSHVELSFRGNDYIVNAEPVFDEAGKLIYIVKSAVNVTELNSLVKNQQILNICLEAFLKDDDVERSMKFVLETIALHMHADRCYVLSFDTEKYLASGFSEYAAPGKKEIFKDCVDLPFSPNEPWYQLFLEHKPITSTDLTNEEDLIRVGSWRETIQLHKMKSFYASGIYLDGKLWGDIGLIYETEKYEGFTEQIRNFLQATAHFIELMLARKREQERLLDALKQAQSADRAKSFFIASVSHEIRTPLNAVIGFSELLRDGNVDPEEQKEYLDNIAYSGNALLQLINDVLDLSKLEAGQIQIVHEPTDFKELGVEVMKVFTYRAAESSLKLNVEIPALPILDLDKLRIRQILFNLIGNAVKFTPSGSVTLRAEFTPADASEGVFHFAVIDTGIGIASDDQSKLMLPFVQLSGMRGTNATNNGTGLGLSISKRLVEKMGGKLNVKSELGKGSTFSVELTNVPFNAASWSKIIDNRKEEKKTVHENRGFSVLLVDDVDMNLKVMTALCKKSGISHVVAVDSGMAALKVLEKEPFDLLLTDMWMPGMNGAELAEKIHTDPRFANLPIIAVTADIEAKDNFPMQAFSGVLLKPITMEKIQKIVSFAHVGRSI